MTPPSPPRAIRALLREYPPMADKVRRRLTTLLCADAAGYTRLMGADEAGTLATLRRRRAAMATLIERHLG
jgi:adenylate cyclase